MLLYKSKENILKKIRTALVETTPVPYIQSEGNNNLFEAPHDDLAVIFAEAFTKLDGKFAFVDNEKELTAVLEQLIKTSNFQKIYCCEEKLQQVIGHNGLNIDYTDDLAGSDISITSCISLVARTGTIVLGSTLPNGRTASVYSPVHLCIAYTSQLVYDNKDILQKLKDEYHNQLPSCISFASGPSRTADIEKTLVKGIHGPKEVICILVEN